MPFKLSYMMLVGRGSREVGTGAEAIEAYRELQSAGASYILITAGGTIRTIEPLVSGDLGRKLVTAATGRKP
ncbi:MAG: hypothetical protein JWQ89_2448 [Devosia sp.]|uniref:hypothetical protein n=1 Tax=Devosia sp. TaxID=1871048 RepID=UPI002614086A|nr:hypothetical protein [Devosia sp.]MDB5540721.1 hypothetical protein [Devosia sp.]